MGRISRDRTEVEMRSKKLEKRNNNIEPFDKLRVTWRVMWDHVIVSLSNYSLKPYQSDTVSDLLIRYSCIAFDAFLA